LADEDDSRIVTSAAAARFYAAAVEARDRFLRAMNEAPASP